jgi:hypothetical protein
MATDGAGGVFAVGEAHYQSGTGVSYALVRYKDAGSSVWNTVATVPAASGQNAFFSAVAVAPSGAVYVAALGGVAGATANIQKGTWNADHTALSLSVVDTPTLGQYRYFTDLAIDAAGNVFAVGKYTTSTSKQHWFVRRQTAEQGAFATVNDYMLNNTHTRAYGVTVIPSGVPNAGVYVVGHGGADAHGTNLGSRWIVRKSTNGGSTWSTVDSFQIEPSTNSPSAAEAVVADHTGVLHVVGRVSTRVRTGGTNKNPTYRYDHRWYLRSSSNGGSSWSSEDVYPEFVKTLFLGQAVEGWFNPEAVVTDQAGKVYIAGPVDALTVNSRSVVRTNADGAWSTSDDFHADGEGYTRAYGLARDSSGAIYVGGMAANHWAVRSMTPAAPLAAASGTGGSIFADSPLRDVRDDMLAELT